MAGDSHALHAVLMVHALFSPAPDRLWSFVNCPQTLPKQQQTAGHLQVVPIVTGEHTMSSSIVPISSHTQLEGESRNSVELSRDV
jgi:hypothetical protein